MKNFVGGGRPLSTLQSLRHFASPKRNTILRVACVLLLFYILSRLEVFNYRPSGSTPSTIIYNYKRVDAFAGSDVVVYRGEGPATVYLQAFNSAPYQMGVSMLWQLPVGVFANTSLGSIVQVTGADKLPAARYPFRVVITNDAGEKDESSVTVHVIERQTNWDVQERAALLQPRLEQRIIVLLPQNSVTVTVIDQQTHNKLGLDTYEWIKETGSPFMGECRPKKNTGHCTGLVEGVYSYSVVSSGPRVSLAIRITIAVNPAQMRVYDHASQYSDNVALLPVYIKAEAVVPDCEPDKSAPKPRVDDLLLLRHLEARAVNNTVVLGFTGDSYLALARNWLCSVKAAIGKDNYLVIAFDTVARDAMLDMERQDGGSPLAVYYDQVLLQNRRMTFTARTKHALQAWKEIMSVKTTVIEAIVRLGFNVFVMDADTVLLRNPFPYLWSRAANCDVQWQADGKDRFEWDELQARTHFNAGVYFAYSSPRLQALYRHWLAGYGCKKGRREQHALTLALHNTFRGQWTLLDPILNPKTVPSNVVKFCYLDSKLFPDGGFFVYHDKYRSLFGDSQPTLLHANNLQQDEAAKKRALQAHRAWFLDSSERQCQHQ